MYLMVFICAALRCYVSVIAATYRYVVRGKDGEQLATNVLIILGVSAFSVIVKGLGFILGKAKFELSVTKNSPPW